MKAVIDRDACTDCGMCIDNYPGLFEDAGERPAPKAGEVEYEHQADLLQAVEDCPTGAISVAE